MTLRRALGWYLGVGVILITIFEGVDGVRGLTGAGAAWLVCFPALILPTRAWRVAVGQRNPKIGGAWKMLPTGDLLFRLAWTLGAGGVVFYRFGGDLGVGFWIALLVLYQVVLALRTVALVSRLAAVPGDSATDAFG